MSDAVTRTRARMAAVSIKPEIDEVRDLILKPKFRTRSFESKVQLLVDGLNEPQASFSPSLQEPIFDLIDGRNGMRTLDVLAANSKRQVVGRECIRLLSMYAGRNSHSKKGVHAAGLLGEVLNQRENRGEAALNLSHIARSSESASIVAEATLTILSSGVKQLHAGLREEENRTDCVKAVSFILDELIDDPQWDRTQSRPSDFARIYFRHPDLLTDYLSANNPRDDVDYYSYVNTVIELAWRSGNTRANPFLDILENGLKDDDNRGLWLTTIGYHMASKPDSHPLNTNFDGVLRRNMALIEGDLIEGKHDAYEFMSRTFSTEGYYWSFLKDDMKVVICRNVSSLAAGLSKVESSTHSLDLLVHEIHLPKAREAVEDYVVKRTDGLAGVNGDGVIDVHRLVSAWSEGAGYTPSDTFGRNIRNLIELEKRVKGGAPALHKKFGILDYGRYTVDTLARLHAKINKTGDGHDTRPLIFIAMPRRDHNGAYYQDAAWIENLSINHNLVIVENETRLQLVRSMQTAVRDYGQISGMIMCGHGAGQSIGLGGRGSRHRLHINDLSKPQILPVADLFVINPIFILSSCSSGSYNGLGMNISSAIHGRVSAPSQPTHPKNVNAWIHDGLLYMDVDWADEGVGRHFHNGRRMKRTEK